MMNLCKLCARSVHLPSDGDVSRHRLCRETVAFPVLQVGPFFGGERLCVPGLNGVEQIAGWLCAQKHNSCCPGYL